MKSTELTHYLNQLLQINEFSDYAPNGLQVEGKADINHIVSGVTACKALIDEAIALNADAVLVHHGYFWKGEDPCVTRMKRQRLKALLAHDINLYAYHLPLDAHPEFGNNALLAKALSFAITGELNTGPGPKFGYVGSCDAISGEGLAKAIHGSLGRAPLHIEAPSQKPITKLAWCTGAAQDYIEVAVDAGCDAFISGEVSERTVHVARECDIHYFAAGHHATERFGVQALGQHVADKFGIQHTFVDIENPV